ncbi:MAG: alpha/beta fold hydrolase [Labilithrix sp.]|nr:alpha/beta fold hydrolase [Labilithrix sp.]MCW5816235.1 alpha/beta fold hydrolase [Labilithrix sp.]
MLRLALIVGGASIGAFFVGIWGYALVSFFSMRAHTARRELGLTLRELLRETFLTALTQPFLPLYYLIGDRMEPLFQRQVVPKPGDPPRVPIVFVHGYMQNRVGFIGLARALARKGFGPLYGINYPWWSTIPANAKRLARYVDRVCRETKSTSVDLVCHSMGGLVAMEMMRSTAKEDHFVVRRCVTIASPHAGVAWRGPMLGFGATNLRRGSKLLEAHAGYTVAIPTLSVFSSHDNIVHPKETSSLLSRGGVDFEVAGPSHFSILFSPLVADEVAAFLASPDRGAPELA